MDYREIEKVPEFRHDIDESLLAKLSPDDPLKSVLINSNIIRQQSRWSCDVALKAFNLSIQLEAKLERAQRWLMVLVVGMLVAALVKFLLSK